MRTRATLAVLVVLVLAAAWCLQPGAPPAARPTAGSAIIAFGDSLVAGQGASAGADFVSILSQRLGVPIINAGRGGDTTAAALGRLNGDVLARDPRVVIVLLGGNDFLRRVPADVTFSNLAAIVERIRASGAAVVLVGIRVGLWSDSYGERYEALAARTGSAYVPDVLDDIFQNSSRMADSIHPNDEGYRIMADRIEPAVRALVEGSDRGQTGVRRGSDLGQTGVRPGSDPEGSAHRGDPLAAGLHRQRLKGTRS